MPKNLKSRLQRYKDNIVDDENAGGDSTDNGASGSIEQTGFNIISMIKSHLSHGVPLMFHVVEYYSQLGRRRRFNQFIFWIIAYIGQLLDMIFSIIYGLLMIAIASIVVIAIARGVGLGDFLIQIIEALK